MADTFNQLLININVLIISILSAIFFILILLSFFLGKTPKNFMSILHVHLTSISLLQSINYMYFFDNAKFTDRENVGTLCNIQSAAVPALAMGQITILAILGYMMKKIFNNPDLIESYTKRNYILIIIFSWILPIILFTISMIIGGNRLDLAGYCRPDKHKVFLAILFVVTLAAFIIFFHSVVSLGNTIKEYFKDKESEEEKEKGDKFLRKLKRYNIMLGFGLLKWVLDLGNFVIAIIYEENPGDLVPFIYAFVQKIVEVAIIPFYTLTFTITHTRIDEIKSLICCKNKEDEVVWTSDYTAVIDKEKKTEFKAQHLGE